MRYQKMSLLEFEDICRKKGYSKFYFSTEDNPSLRENSSIFFTTQFNKMAVSLAPDTIIFKNDNDVLAFNGIKYILMRIPDDNSLNYAAFKIICETGIYNRKEKTYLMITNIV